MTVSKGKVLVWSNKSRRLISIGEIIEGVKGEGGPQGLQGDKGEKGDRGERGLQEFASVYDVANSVKLELKDEFNKYTKSEINLSNNNVNLQFGAFLAILSFILLLRRNLRKVVK